MVRVTTPIWVKMILFAVNSWWHDSSPTCKSCHQLIFSPKSVNNIHLAVSTKYISAKIVNAENLIFIESENTPENTPEEEMSFILSRWWFQ